MARGAPRRAPARHLALLALLIAPGGPALAVPPAAISISSSSFTVSFDEGEATFELEICNTSNNDSIPFSVGLVLDSDTAPDGGSIDHEWPLNEGLQGNECRRLDHPVPLSALPSELGSYRAWALADIHGALKSNEIVDGEEKLTYHIGPNLLVDSELTPSPAVDGNDVTFKVTVCNHPEASRAVETAFELGLWFITTEPVTSCPTPAADKTWKISEPLPLVPGACVGREVTIDSVTNGSYTAQYLADAECDVDESTEEDNHATKAFTVGGGTTGDKPDLVVTRLGAEVDGDSVVFVATVCNAGHDVAPDTTSALFFSREEQPTCGVATAPDATAPLADLGPGECVNQAWVRRATPTLDEATAHVLLDWACKLDELDEANNAASVPYTVEDGAGGCSASARSPRASSLWWLLLLAAALFFRRRR